MTVHAIARNQSVSHQELIGQRIEVNLRKRRCKAKNCNTRLSIYNGNKFCFAHMPTNGFSALLDEDKQAQVEYIERCHKGTIRRRYLRNQEKKLKTKAVTKQKEN